MVRDSHPTTDETSYKILTQKGEEKLKEIIHCYECKHLMFSDCYAECNVNICIVSPYDTCEHAEKRTRQKGIEKDMPFRKKIPVNPELVKETALCANFERELKNLMLRVINQYTSGVRKFAPTAIDLYDYTSEAEKTVKNALKYGLITTKEYAKLMPIISRVYERYQLMLCNLASPDKILYENEVN